MKIVKEEIAFYTIVEEGLMSTEGVGEGRMIPSLVIDVLGNKDIEDLIKVHDSITSGDVKMNWRYDFFDRSFFTLKLEFIKPMEITFGVKFKIASEYPLIDGIMESKGCYLQTGVKGDKISKKLNDPKILIEVPDVGFKDKWNEILMSMIKKKYRKKGFSKRESIDVTRKHISEMRKMWKIRR